MIYKVGPFTVYKRETTIDVSLTCLGGCGFGWEYGWDDGMATRKPVLSIRLGKLVLFHVEFWRWGWEIWILGFWWIV